MKLGNIFKQTATSDDSSSMPNSISKPLISENSEINWKQKGVNAAGLAQGKGSCL